MSFPRWSASFYPIVLSGTVLLGAPVFAEKPEISVSPTRVQATGIKRGGEAIWLAASVEPFNGSVRLRHVIKVTKDDDLDRTVGIDVDVKPYSIFVVVDLASGEYASVMASRSDPLPLQDRSLGVAWMRDATYLDFDVSDAHVLLVRPDAGVWKARVSQGSYTDDDGHHDGNLRIALRRMTPVIGTEPAPSAALPQDLLVVVDNHRLSAFIRMAKEKN